MRNFYIIPLALGLGAITSSYSTVHGQASPGVFGQAQPSEAALIGIMYDFKQTPDRKGTAINAGNYGDVVDEFLKKNWDEGVLERYYRVSRPLYTTQVFIPNMDAAKAPAAFGAEKTVQPTCWVVHYKGQVSPPSPGTYRFWGCADDTMAVAVNGKSELVFCRPDMSLPTNGWKQSEPDGAQASDDFLRPGDWFTVAAGDIIDLDIIIGERPGGLFNAFVMIEKKGEAYQKDTQGHPILPIFQVAAYDTPVINDVNREPEFAKGFPPWKSYQ
jgi:hypothetical protein